MILACCSAGKKVFNGWMNGFLFVILGGKGISSKYIETESNMKE